MDGLRVGVAALGEERQHALDEVDLTRVIPEEEGSAATEGVVKKIDENSAQLKSALETGKAIIVTTLQKFPVISASMTELKGKRFAVIDFSPKVHAKLQEMGLLRDMRSAGLDPGLAADRVRLVVHLLVRRD